jgi:hypothetical protein
MKISKDAVPPLIDAVKTTLEEELAAHDRHDFDEEEHYDPNDLIIFDSFVLPVLENAVETGFDSEEMLYKGFSFMVFLIPWYLNNHSSKLSPPVYGELAKIYYTYCLKDALRDVTDIGNDHLWENVKGINQQIKSCMLIEQKPWPWK